jgi:hypothetical protein
LAITSPASGYRSVDIVRSRTQTIEFIIIIIIIIVVILMSQFIDALCYNPEVVGSIPDEVIEYLN